MAAGLRELATKYGPVAVGTYLALSFSTFCTLFVAIESHLDVEALLKRVMGASVDVQSTLKAWGLAKRADDEEQPQTLYGRVVSKAPSAALALLISKALIPIKVPVAAVLTPAVARILEARGLVARRR